MRIKAIVHGGFLVECTSQELDKLTGQEGRKWEIGDEINFAQVAQQVQNMIKSKPAIETMIGQLRKMADEAEREVRPVLTELERMEMDLP